MPCLLACSVPSRAAQEGQLATVAAKVSERVTGIASTLPRAPILAPPAPPAAAAVVVNVIIAAPRPGLARVRARGCAALTAVVVVRQHPLTRAGPGRDSRAACAWNRVAPPAAAPAPLLVVVVIAVTMRGVAVGAPPVVPTAGLVWAGRVRRGASGRGGTGAAWSACQAAGRRVSTGGRRRASHRTGGGARDGARRRARQ